MVLADFGGSNAPRIRCFRYALQRRLADPHHLKVTVCHYPSRASKWHPIDHRLFSEIRKNWASHPLRSYHTVLNHIRTTTTDTGLRVNALLVGVVHTDPSTFNTSFLISQAVAPRPLTLQLRSPFERVEHTVRLTRRSYPRYTIGRRIGPLPR